MAYERIQCSLNLDDPADAARAHAYRDAPNKSEFIRECIDLKLGKRPLTESEAVQVLRDALKILSQPQNVQQITPDLLSSIKKLGL